MLAQLAWGWRSMLGVTRSCSLVPLVNSTRACRGGPRQLPEAGSGRSHTSETEDAPLGTDPATFGRRRVSPKGSFD